ncbi:3'(2'),5'-bisphosphate nucleotidase CysQ [Tamlana crocina]
MREVLIKAIEAAVLAGEEIMKVYSGVFDVVLKPDNSPLTQADEKANAVINAVLEETNISIISEENAAVSYSERKKWNKCWVVDPLDGTKEFVNKNGEFTVNIALVENGQPVLGVIYVPVSKTLYYAIVSENIAYRIVLGSHQVSEGIFENSVIIKPDSKPKQQLKVVASRSHLNDETESFINDLKLKGEDVVMVSKGSSLKFCLLAEGEAHVYPRFAPTMEWDIAAGHAICNAVGIKVSQVGAVKELRYNKESLLNPYFLAKTVV